MGFGVHLFPLRSFHSRIRPVDLLCAFGGKFSAKVKVFEFEWLQKRRQMLKCHLSTV